MRRPAALMGVFCVLYAVIAWQQPLGGHFDAFAMWNVRAKFFALGENPLDAFSALAVPFHPDYPPLVPLIVGGVWRLLGGVSPAAAIGLHGAVYGAILWLLRRDWRALVMGGACGLTFAPMQIADTPLALALLCAMVAWRAGRWGWVGIALGTALLIKNEGALMAGVVIALAYLSPDPSPNSGRGERIMRVGLGMLPGVIALAAWKVWIGSANDVIGAGGLIERLTSVERWDTVLPLVGEGALHWRAGGLVIVPMVAVVMRWRVWWMGAAACGAIVAGYVVIYAITPHDVVWHISTSWDRLLWQVFPAAVWAMMAGKE